MVCDICKDVLLGRAALLEREPYERTWEGKKFVHHWNVEDLRRAAENKCLLCNTFWTDLSDDIKQTLSNKARGPSTLPLTKAWIDWKSLQGNKVTIDFASTHDSINYDGIKWFRVLEPTDTAGARTRAIGQRVSVSAATNVSEIRDRLQRWIQKCMSTHKRCNCIASRAGWNPKRLIRIDAALGDNVQLVNAGKDSAELDYATLSHRWGDGQFFKLTSATKNELKRGISMHRLSLTFQHAILVARGLSLQYVWIDSLCIMQDKDKADWLQESSSKVMHKVYGYGYVNISATGARDGSEGLFSTNDSRVFNDVPMMTDIFGGQSSNPEPRTIYYPNFWEEGVYTAPLNRRGWVFQERLLAKRVIHFSQQQVLWECHELDAAENFPDGLPGAMEGRFVTGFKNLDPMGKIPGLKGTDDPRYYANKIWCRIVITYSQCCLTVPTDKLLAISGIAQRMSGTLQDEYVAGMWYRTLASDLLWFVAGHGGASRCRSRYIAPTWSWASVNAQVYMDLVIDHAFRFNVKGYSLSYVSDDRMGMLQSGGYVLLEGVLKPIVISRTEPVSCIHVESRVTYTTYLTLEIHGKGIPCYEAIITSGHPDGLALDADEDDISENIYCMEGCIVSSEHTDTQAELYMLLLRCVDEKDGTYTRIGISRHIESESWHTLLERDADEESLPSVSWNQETRLHTIRII